MQEQLDQFEQLQESKMNEDTLNLGLSNELDQNFIKDTDSDIARDFLECNIFEDNICADSQVSMHKTNQLEKRIEIHEEVKVIKAPKKINSQLTSPQ